MERRGDCAIEIVSGQLLNADIESTIELGRSFYQQNGDCTWKTVFFLVLGSRDKGSSLIRCRHHRHQCDIRKEKEE